MGQDTHVVPDWVVPSPVAVDDLTHLAHRNYFDAKQDVESRRAEGIMTAVVWACRSPAVRR